MNSITIARIVDLRRAIARLREEVWLGRTDEDKREGRFPPGMDYAKMCRIQELQEEMDELLKGK